jgi:hypothetical protein
MTKAFQFGEDYELRLATAADLDRARAWTNADEHHRGIISPEFWIEQGNGIESYVLTQRGGEMFFFRVERVARVLIQFAPQEERQQERMRKALTAGMAFLDMALGARGYGELVFDSTSRLLRLFAVARLRFAQRPETLSRRLQIYAPKPKDAPKPLSEANDATEGRETLHEAIHDGLQGDK